MRRHPMMAAVLCAAALGMGVAVPPIEPFDESDEGFLKAREAQEIEERRQIERARERQRLRAEQDAEARRRSELAAQGIDPDTGRPFSRQHRRWRERRGL